MISCRIKQVEEMVITEPLPSAVKDIVNDTKIMKKSAILNQDKFCAIY